MIARSSSEDGPFTSEIIELKEGELAKIENIHANGSQPTLLLSVYAEIESGPKIEIVKGPLSADLNGSIIAGPARIYAELRSPSTGTDEEKYVGIASVVIAIGQNESSIHPFSPSNAVVIPEDADGQVEIILESSSDLINWNVANPGTYDASSKFRFFRVRAKVK